MLIFSPLFWASGPARKGSSPPLQLEDARKRIENGDALRHVAPSTLSSVYSTAGKLRAGPGLGTVAGRGLFAAELSIQHRQTLARVLILGPSLGARLRGRPAMRKNSSERHPLVRSPESGGIVFGGVAVMLHENHRGFMDIEPCPELQPFFAVCLGARLRARARRVKGRAELHKGRSRPAEASTGEANP